MLPSVRPRMGFPPPTSQTLTGGLESVAIPPAKQLQNTGAVREKRWRAAPMLNKKLRGYLNDVYFYSISQKPWRRLLPALPHSPSVCPGAFLARSRNWRECVARFDSLLWLVSAKSVCAAGGVWFTHPSCTVLGAPCVEALWAICNHIKDLNVVRLLNFTT